jgi:acyl-homoserine lactone acylase PvdQ
MDISGANVTRADVSTVIATKRPPADYYPFLGDKPHFKRRLVTHDTLRYSTHQRQAEFYDKTEAAKAKNMAIPDPLRGCHLLRCEVRYLEHVSRQLKADVTAATLYNEVFYQSIVQNWYKEFKTIQKLKEQEFMIDNISSSSEAKTALFAHLLQQAGLPTIDEFMAALKAQKRFKSRSEYSKLRGDLNKIMAAPRGEQGDLMRELETAIYDVAKYAR